MKKTLTLLCCCIVLFANAQTSITGKITDKETAEELIAANVVLYKEGVLITGVATDFDGNYSLNIDPGTYDIEVSYIGYQPHRTNGIVTYAGLANKHDVKLGSGGDVTFCDFGCPSEYKIPLIRQDDTTSGATIDLELFRQFR